MTVGATSAVDVFDEAFVVFVSASGGRGGGDETRFGMVADDGR